MIDLEDIKKDVVNRVLVSSGKRLISKEVMYGLNLIQTLAQQEISELKAKLAKYESDDVVVVPRNANSDMLNNGWSAIGYDSIEEDDISNVYKAMIEVGEIK